MDSMKKKILTDIISDLMKMPVGKMGKDEAGEEKPGVLKIAALSVGKPKLGEAEDAEEDLDSEAEAEEGEDLDLAVDPEERKAQLKKLMGF